MREKIILIKLFLEFEKGKYSNILLNSYFSSRKLPVPVKSFITEIFYGVIRNKIFLDYIIKLYAKKIKIKWIYYDVIIALYQIYFMDSNPDKVIWEATELSKKFGIDIPKFVNGLLKNILKDKYKIKRDLEDGNRYDIIYSYPEWIYTKLQEKKDYLEIMSYYKQIPKPSFRVNTLKYNIEEFEEYLAKEKINILKKIDTVYYLSKGHIVNDTLFKEGKIIVQDASSYLACKILSPIKGEKILDCCAAPGGKAILIAELMHNYGEVLAIDIYEHKLKLIQENAKKMGINIIKSLLLDATKINQDLKDVLFDKILLDAPCSGLGVMRKKPEIVYNRTYEDVIKLKKKQREILEAVKDNLKVGGYLVYSTCTILDEENIINIKEFLNDNRNYVVEDISNIINSEGHLDEIGGLVIDHKSTYLDGFYIIKLKRIM